MKFFRISTLLAIALAVLSGAALFWTSQNVQRAESDLRRLKKAQAYEEQTIRVLHAEWDYLNRPDRLEALASEYLDLVPPDIRKVARGGDLLPDALAPVVPGRKPDQEGGLKEQALFTQASMASPPAATVMFPPRPSLKPDYPAQKKFKDLLGRLGNGKEGR